SCDQRAPATSSLSLHDALPILNTVAGPGNRATPSTPEGPASIDCQVSPRSSERNSPAGDPATSDPSATTRTWLARFSTVRLFPRSEEHTSELQSRENLVCRLLL